MTISEGRAFFGDEQFLVLLVDDAKAVFDHLMNSEKPLSRVDFILDNYGPELVHDIALADYMLSTDLVPYIQFHAKPYPYYVSDVMIKDMHTALDQLESSSDIQVQQLAKRMRDHYQKGRLQIKEVCNGE